MKIILASSSPRRVTLLRSVVSSFDIVSPTIEETHERGHSPQFIAMKNAYRKANSARDNHQHDSILVIAADTIVFTQKDRLFGKPKNTSEAIEFLKSLSGNHHWVVTGVALFFQKGSLITWELFSELTRVTFNQISSEDIRSYIKQFMPLDKAGAYGIQELPNHFVHGLEGSLSNVIGLPLEAIEQRIKLISD